MRFRTRLALHDFGLRAIGLTIVLGQAAFAVWTAVKIPLLGGACAAGILLVAGSNARALASWWSNP